MLSHFGSFSIKNNYTFELVNTEEGLAALTTDWAILYEKVVPKNPFLTCDWSLAWREDLGAAPSPFILLVWCKDELVGLAPLRLEKKWGLRLLRFFEDGRSDYLGFLVAPGHTDVARLLMDQLYEHAQDWDVLLLRKMSELFVDMTSFHVSDHYRRVEIIASTAPYLSSKSDLNELCVSGPPELRRIKRKIRKFEREGGLVKRITGPDVAQAAKNITAVEANSWKAGTYAARFQKVEELRTLERVLGAYGARGEVEVWLATLADEPIAYLLNFLMPERTCYYQGAYNNDYRRYSPGGILHFHAVERTWQEGPREYDLMTGDEDWKKGWANGERVLKHIAVFKKTFRGYLAFSVLLGLRWYFRKFDYAHSVYGIWRDITNSIRRTGGV
ncbi:MAG: GNAT family N-acetyltransferase [Halioglobus sp.]